MFKILLFSLLLISVMTTAQDNRKILNGIVMDDINPLSRVHCININTKKATYTNEKGVFKIFAQINDSLKLTSIGYKTKIIKVDATHFGIHNNRIHLDKEIIELDEVEIKNHRLTGFLSLDTKQVKTEKEINAKSLNLPNAGNRKLTTTERRLFTAYGGGVLGIDIIINILSGRIKKLKKLKKIEDDEKQVAILKKLYTNHIIHDLKIDTTDVYRFIYFCQEAKEFKHKQGKDELTVIEFLQEKAIEFKKLNEKP